MGISQAVKSTARIKSDQCWHQDQGKPLDMSDFNGQQDFFQALDKK